MKISTRLFILILAVFAIPFIGISQITSFPWNEGFENAGSIPTGWTNETVSSTVNFTFATGGYSGNPSGAHGGTYNALFYSGNYNSDQTKLVTPELNLTGVSSPTLTFWHTQVDWGGDQDELKVYYRTSATGAWTLIPNLSFTTSISSWTQELQIPLPNPSSTYYIAFDAKSGYGYGVCIDDVKVEAAAACPLSTELAVSSTTSSSTQLNWKSGGATNFKVEYGLDGFTKGTGTLYTVSTDTFKVLTGLAANTTYQWYVQDSCGVGDVSTWAGPSSFYTGYCTPAPSSVDGSGITNITFSNVNNTTGDETGHYGDYSSMVGIVYQASTVAVDITYATGYTYVTKIWVDWNDDLDFNDIGEEVYSGESTNSNPTTLAASFTVPGTATVGNHRMRIGGADSGPITPCYTGSYGSLEDYTINVMAMPNNEIEVSSILGNYSAIGAGNYTVKAIVKNNGLNAQTNVAVKYQFDNGAVVSQTIASLPSLAIDTFSFTTQVNSGTVGTHQLMVYTSLAGDANTANDTAFAVVTNIAFPYFNNFDSYADNSIPTSWTVNNTTGNTSAYGKVYNSATSAHSGTKSFTMYNSGGTTGSLISVLPQVLTTTINNLYLDFWLKGSGSDLIIGAMTDPNDNSTFVGIDTIVNPATSVLQYTISLASYSGSGKYIAFKHGLNYSYDYFYIDDVNLFIPLNNDVEVVKVLGPYGAFGTGNHTIQAVVRNNGLNPQTNFNINYSLDNGTAVSQTIASIAVSAIDTITFTTPVSSGAVGSHQLVVYTTLGTDLNLQNDTAYTLVTNLVFPYFDDFESFASNSIPDYWKVINTTGNTSAYGKVYNSTYNSHSGANTFALSNSGATTGNLLGVLPQLLTSSVSNLYLNFWLKGAASNLIIGALTDPNDASTFVGIDTIFSPSSTMTEYTIDLSTYGGNGKYIAFKHGLNSTYNTFYIDDVNLYMPINNDVGIISMISPVDAVCGDAASPVKVVAKNFGLSAQNAVQISAIFTTPTGIVTLTGTSGNIAPNSIDTVSLGNLNTIADGSYMVKAYTSLSGDGSAANDTLMTGFTISTPLTVDHIEDFSSTTNWNLSGMSTSSTHGLSGNGLYKNFYSSTSAQNGSAIMNKKIGPVPATAQLIFDYRIVDYSGYTTSPTAAELQADSFAILISGDCGQSFDTIYMIDSNTHVQAITWRQISVPLTNYANQEVIIGFSGKWNAGDYYFDLDNFGIAAPTMVNLGADTSFCAGGSVSLVAGTNTTYSYLWTLNGDTLANTNTSLMADTTGIYTVEISTVLGMAYDTIQITVNPLPVVSFTGLAATYCSNDMAATLVGIPSAGVFTGNGITTNSFDPSMTGSGQQVITYTYTDANMCTASISNTTMVEASPAATMSANATICEGDSAMISVNGATAVPAAQSMIFSVYIEGTSNNKAIEVFNTTGATLQLDNYRIAQSTNGGGWAFYHTFPAGATLAAYSSWVMVTDQTASNLYDTSLANEVLGYPSVVHHNGDDARAIEVTTDGGTTWTMIDLIGDPNNDPGSAWPVAGVNNATANYTLVRKPSISVGDTNWMAIAGTDSLSSQYLVYPVNSFNLLDSHVMDMTAANLTYLWSNGATTADQYVMPTATTTYTVTVSNGNCSEMGTTTISVNPVPVVNLGADATICEGDSLNLIAGTASGNIYLWSNGSTAADQYVMPMTTTNYSVIVTSANCSATDSVEITVNPVPVVSLGADQMIKWTAGSLILDAGNAGATYLWNTGATTQTETFDNTNLTNSTVNTVYVDVTDNGCTGTDTLLIDVWNDVSINVTDNNIALSIYPNPTAGLFQVDVEGMDNEQYELGIYTASGSQLFIETSSFGSQQTQSFKFDLASYPKGIYFVRLQSNASTIVKRVIIK